MTRPRGFVLFNVVEHTWEEQGFPAIIADLAASNTWTELEDSGPFRPYTLGEADLMCRFFVFRVNKT